MSAEQDDCICVRHWEFSETSQTVGIFGRRTGLFRAIAKGSRRPRSTFAGGVDLLIRAEAEMIHSHHGELSTLCSWRPVEMYPMLRGDLGANRAAFYCADLVSRMLEAHDPHPDVFDSLTGFLGQLEAGSAVAVALLEFQWSLLRSGGWQPRLELADHQHSPVETLQFSASLGGVVTDAISDSWPVRATTIETLRGVVEVPTPTTGTPVRAFDSDSVDRANRLLAAYIRTLINAEPHTMKALFGEIQVPAPRTGPPPIQPTNRPVASGPCPSRIAKPP